MDQTETYETVAAEVRATLARHRIRQADLARALGASPQAVSRRVRGDVPWDVAELATVANMVGVPVASFFERVA